MHAQAPAIRRRQHDGVRLARSLANHIDGTEQRLRLEHHSRPAAKGHIVHHTVPIGGEVAQVVNHDLQQPVPNRPRDDAFFERSPSSERW